MTDITAAAHRAKADAADTEAAASFERSDTDGFVSQWAGGITARLHRALAAIADAGGKAEFPALFDTAGNLVAAKLVNGKYGPVWGILPSDDPRGRFTGWFNPSGAATAAKRQAADARKGYQVGRVLAPAAAKVDAPPGARGVSGATSVFISTYRTDTGFSRDADVVSVAHYPAYPGEDA